MSDSEYRAALQEFKKWWTRPCISCGAKPGNTCVTRDGKSAKRPHVLRTVEKVEEERAR